MSSISFAVLLALLLAAMLVVGGLVAGSWPDDRRSLIDASPLPSTLAEEPSRAPVSTPPLAAESFDCTAAQSSASKSATGWVAGPPQGAMSDAQRGWIAVWNTDPTPEVILINPVTGAPCPLVRFTGYTSPSVEYPDGGPRDWVPVRGPLAWSPDGTALAIVVVDTVQPRQHLYVWSPQGLAGPLFESTANTWLRDPAWAPDGSRLAVGQTLGSVPPDFTTADWIVSADGSARRLEFNCGACYGGAAYWSPAGDRIAVLVDTRDPAAQYGLAVGSPAGGEIALLPGRGLVSVDWQLLGWADDETVLFFDPVRERFIGIPASAPLELVDYGELGAPRPELFDSSGMSSRLGFSPDRTMLAQVLEKPRGVNQPAGVASLRITDVATGERWSRVSDLPAWSSMWWAPDGRSVGYLVDIRTPDQGVWSVDVDGTGHRQVAAGSYVMQRENFTPLGAWQPVWPR